MDNEQLEQRIQWLDDERRKDKAMISELEDRFHQVLHTVFIVSFRIRSCLPHT